MVLYCAAWATNGENQRPHITKMSRDLSLGQNQQRGPLTLSTQAKHTTRSVMPIAETLRFNLAGPCPTFKRHQQETPIAGSLHWQAHGTASLLPCSLYMTEGEPRHVGGRNST